MAKNFKVPATQEEFLKLVGRKFNGPGGPREVYKVALAPTAVSEPGRTSIPADTPVTWKRPDGCNFNPPDGTVEWFVFMDWLNRAKEMKDPAGEPTLTISVMFDSWTMRLDNVPEGCGMLFGHPWRRTVTGLEDSYTLESPKGGHALTEQPFERLRGTLSRIIQSESLKQVRDMLAVVDNGIIP